MILRFLFVRAFRRHLACQRHLREHRRCHFEMTLRYSVGNICVSAVNEGSYVVWRRSTHCGYVKVLSEWDYFSRAIHSANLCFLRRQAEAVVNQETGSSG